MKKTVFLNIRNLDRATRDRMRALCDKKGWNYKALLEDTFK